MRLLRCPACRSVNVEWYERSELVIHFRQSAQGVDPDGFPAPPDPRRVTGECSDCGHAWTARGAMMIQDIPGHPEHEL